MAIFTNRIMLRILDKICRAFISDFLAKFRRTRVSGRKITIIDARAAPLTEVEIAAGEDVMPLVMQARIMMGHARPMQV